MNVHVDVTDVESSEVTSVHRGVSSRIRNAFSSSSFLRTATLHVGGSPSLYQVNVSPYILYPKKRKLCTAVLNFFISHRSH